MRREKKPGATVRWSLLVPTPALFAPRRDDRAVLSRTVTRRELSTSGDRADGNRGAGGVVRHDAESSVQREVHDAAILAVAAMSARAEPGVMATGAGIEVVRACFPARNEVIYLPLRAKRCMKSWRNHVT